jgi:hypothetical protein
LIFLVLGSGKREAERGRGREEVREDVLSFSFFFFVLSLLSLFFFLFFFLLPFLQRVDTEPGLEQLDVELSSFLLFDSDFFFFGFQRSEKRERERETKADDERRRERREKREKKEKKGKKNSNHLLPSHQVQPLLRLRVAGQAHPGHEDAHPLGEAVELI